MSETQKHTKPNVPNLRFPGFEGEWESRALGEVAEISKGSGISKEQRSSKGNPCILYGELYTTYLTEIIEDVVSRTQLPITGLVSSKANDVIIPASGETAIDISTARCVTNSGVLLGGDLNIIRLNNQDGRFFSYQLNGVRKKDIAKIAQGVSIVHLHGGDLSRILINYPSLAEQGKISSLLTLIDKRISIQNKVIKDLLSLKEAVTSRILHSSNSEKKTLGEITEVFSTRNKHSIKYPMYSITNEKGFKPQSEQFEDREMEGEDISAYKLINRGEIAYNPARINVGSIAQYNGNETCMISSLYVCVRAKTHISSKWLIHILKSKQLLFYYNLYAEGGVRLYLFYPNFSRIRINVPSHEEQTRIASVLDSIDRRIELEKGLHTRLNDQKKYLLSQLFV